MKQFLAILFCLSLISPLFAASDEWEEAYEAYRDKDWQKAIELFQKVNPEDPKYATAMRYAGYNVYGRELGQWDKAIPLCVKAYEADPDDIKVLEDLGRACLKRKEQLRDRD